MIFAYLVSAYDQPGQLLTLLDRLLSADERDFVVLHLDAKAALPDDLLDDIADRHGDRVLNVSPPETVLWGHHSQVVATRRQIALALTRPFDMAHLVSGSDWPVVSRARIVCDLSGHTELPCCVKMLGVVQEERMQELWLHDRYQYPRAGGDADYRRKEWNLARATRVANRAMKLLGIVRSRPLGPWHKGWHWWSLPADVCRAVVEDVENLERSGRMRFTVVAIEHVIQTIVATGFAARITTDHRFTDWEGKLTSPHILTRGHLAAIRASDAWFARKVDAAVDNFYLDAFPDFAGPV